MVEGNEPARLVGRDAERAAVAALVNGARDAYGGVLAVRGEAGIGKSLLLGHAREVAVAAGFRVERAVGSEPEMQFAFAGLHQLCAPMLGSSEALPEPQRAALEVAFGLRSGATPERFLVGLAVLNLLTEAAEEVPLLCLVDDAQWLDPASAQVLAFVARRVAADRLALVFGLRDGGEAVDADVFTGLPELRLAGLGETDARALLAAALQGPLDAGVRDRVVAEARGNPLALLELPRAARPAQRSGGFERPDLLGAPRRVEEEFRRRSRGLPDETQMVLLVAAAEPTGEAAVLWRAVGHLGIDRDAAAPAEASGLLEIDTRVRFRHPLVRSAVYRAAGTADHRRAHRALAAATDPRSDPDRRAWHRGHAAADPDETVAAELELSSGRARDRGGPAAAAALLERAAELTPDPADRARRVLDAAHAQHEAGWSAAATELLAAAAAGPLDARHRARAQLLRAQVAFHLARGSEVAGLLVDAAARLAPLDPALSRSTYLRALDTAIVSGSLGGGRGVGEVAVSAAAAPAAPAPSGPADLLLDGLVSLYTRGYAAGAPALHRALEAFRDEDHRGPETGEDHRRWLWLASRCAFVLFDDELVQLLASRHVERAREASALAALPGALLFLSVARVLAGDLTQGAELAAEEAAVEGMTGAVPLLHARLVLAAWRGDHDEVVGLYTASVAEATARGGGTEVGMDQYAASVLHNGRGNYSEALDLATRACATDEPLPHTGVALPELVEAAVRADRPERATAALEELEMRAAASATPWARGLAARSRALVSSGDEAEQHYREAIEQLGRCRTATHLARTHLVYGEWLRREGRRREAREQLRLAHDQLTGMGADAFAARAAHELEATGEHPRRRTPRSTDALTAQELRIARLVATGASTPEVAARLYLSTRTIETHLRHVFRKLDISSRHQIRDLLST